MGFHGMPRQVAEHRGGPRHQPWQFPWHSPRQGPQQSPRQSPQQPTTSTHGIPRQAAVQRKDPRHGVAMEYAVAVAVVLAWVAMVGTTEVATNRTAAGAMATTVALAVEAPCTMESRGPCRGNPRISTVARGKTHGRPRKCHGHCRGSPPKSQTMCTCEYCMR